MLDDGDECPEGLTKFLKLKGNCPTCIYLTRVRIRAFGRFSERSEDIPMYDSTKSKRYNYMKRRAVLDYPRHLSALEFWP